ncbi:TraB/GumN family protein [Mucilaginibacter psychrotolerans]|uniref:TraB/GumN family protein n=1 Tax=Mucilaginibacter psychrotolerans TaxID=1524096 RepID=A0A4Y8SHU8_9SPHI|nr:TraB/GumN family protein [Mucilaginibacter psychrotolerans]TFF38014.1 TraB/GumN family protein [Mucilaginibacter psychrotolerans]
MTPKTKLRFATPYSKIVKAIIALFFLINSIPFVHAQSAGNTSKPGVFYAVTRPGSKDTSYLFGTYHLIKSSYMKNLPNVQKALQKSHGVITEIVLDSSKIQLAQTMGMLKGKTLTGMLNKSLTDSLETELKQSLGIGLAQLDQFKPANITLTLSMVYLIKNNKAMLDKYTGQPLDIYFTDFGKSNHKTLTPLETIEGQMDMLFNHTSEDQQIKELQYFLKNKSEMIAIGDQMMAGWLNNDLAQLNTLYQKSLTLSGEADYLLKDRNLKWMDSLPALLRKDRQFIGVGALHLAGEYGLVALLRAKGFTLTPLKL